MENNLNQKLAGTPKVKKESSVDRIILCKAEAILLAKWTSEFNEKVGGLVKISKADLVNYLIASHAPKLSADEVRGLAVRYYDETRWLGWSVTKMKEAKKKGLSLLFEDLMKFRDEFVGQIIVVGKKRKVPQLSGAILKDDLDAQENLSPTTDTAKLKNSTNEEL